MQDQSSGIRWYNASYQTTGAIGTTIGTGSANTDAIIAEQGPVETSYAAGLARAYTGGGFTEWFLPSINELKEMYDNKSILEAANGFTAFSSSYWSSTEFDENKAWRQKHDNGNQNTKNKANTH